MKLWTLSNINNQLLNSVYTLKQAYQLAGLSEVYFILPHSEPATKYEVFYKW